MNIPDNERKLVVNGVFSVGEPILLTVSKSKSMLEKSKIESVNDATIKLFEDGVFLTDLDTVSKLWYFDYKWDQFGGTSSTESIYRTNYFSGDLKVAADKTYKIEVSAPGIDKKAYVEIKIPTIVPIIKVDTATVKTDQYNEMLQFDMQIADPVAEDNFYLVSLRYKFAKRDPMDPSYNGNVLNTAYIETDDVLIKNDNVNIDNGLLFNDNLFNGKTQNIKFRTSPMWGDTAYFQVVLQGISEDYYNYLISSSLFSANDGNPIAEPVSVKSNVVDGFGIVTAVNPFVDSSIVYIRNGLGYPGMTF
jgi:hypothetical protein